MKESTKTTEGGRTNRTGLALSDHADEMLEVPELTRPTPSNGGIRQEHALYAKQSHAIGTVPPPNTAKGLAKAAMQAITGGKAVALVDKMSERLAFERTGVRLYEALLEKMEVAGKTFSGGPTRNEVQQIRDEELNHAHLMVEALEHLGADPTVMTPSADLVGVEGLGLVQVVNDPRTTVGQCLHALLVAELADNDGWMMMRTMAEELGQKELAKRFSRAEQEEERHLELVRTWLLAHARDQASMT
ncbi:MAG TPA: ferritin-like domain-containing protein [Pseudomonadales bacterium]